MMNIKPNNLFKTPESMKELENDIRNTLPKKYQSQGYLIAAFTWNLACKLANESNESNESKELPNILKHQAS